MRVLPFSHSRVRGLRAFSTFRGDNLGLNTAAPAADVVRQRRDVMASQGISLADCIFMRQVHGERLLEAGGADRGKGSLDLADAIGDCDAMVSATPGSYLCVGHADCQAVLLADPIHRIVGVAHCGWRGASLQLAGKLADTLIRDHGSDPREIWAGMSVCLGPCHLELSTEQHALFSTQAGAPAFCSPLVDGHFRLDLWEHSRAQLAARGIPEGNMEFQRACTACNPERFYSYRRESGHCGRMLSVVGFDR